MQVPKINLTELNANSGVQNVSISVSKNGENFNVAVSFSQSGQGSNANVNQSRVYAGTPLEVQEAIAVDFSQFADNITA